MKKVNWNLEEVKSFNDLTYEEAVMTNGGGDTITDLIWWGICTGVGIVNAPAGAALGLAGIVANAGTITAGESEEEILALQNRNRCGRRC